jgi:hypothetical protein
MRLKFRRMDGRALLGTRARDNRRLGMRLAGCNGSSDAGSRTWWANNVRANWRDPSPQPSRRTGVQHVTQGTLLGVPEVGARSMTEARNYRGIDPDDVAENRGRSFRQFPNLRKMKAEYLSAI